MSLFFVADVLNFPPSQYVVFVPVLSPLKLTRLKALILLGLEQYLKSVCPSIERTMFVRLEHCRNSATK